jgi:cytochrome b involved in lipid metabolism
VRSNERAASYTVPLQKLQKEKKKRKKEMSSVVRVQFKGVDYDVPRTFIENDHPGGADSILEYEGKDMTDAFEAVGHDQDARNILAKFIVAGQTVAAASNTSQLPTNAASSTASAATLTPEERERLLREHRRSWWHFRVTVVPYIVAGVVGVATYVLVANRRAIKK